MKQVAFEALVGPSLLAMGEAISKREPAIQTPFPTWNTLCGEEGGGEGIAQRWLVVIGGADGSGKTYLAANVAAHAVTLGHKVGVINFEMSKVGFTQRYLSILSGEHHKKLSHGRYFDMDAWVRAKRVADSYYEESGGVLITNDSGVFSLDDIATAYDKLAGSGCKMIVLDYAQLVHVPGADGIFQRSEAVANELRILTHKHDVVSVVVSQLNREGKKILRRAPTRHYLQGGSAWENNANQIVMIDHTVKQYVPEDKSVYMQLVMDKNRHGRMGVAWDVAWHMGSMRFDEYHAREIFEEEYDDG